MSNSFESRKPRAEAKVRDLAQENERLQLKLREEQARHDAKVADVKAMEKRIGELRRELDTAAAPHREVKARLEENSQYDRKIAAAAEEENARLAAENTRLIGALAQMFEVCDCGEAHRPTCIGARDGQAGYGCDSCCAHERNENDADGWCVPLHPRSDKQPDCQPARVCEKCGSSGDCIQSCDGKMVSQERR